MEKRKRLHHWLVWVFWISILFTIGFLYYYMDRAIPDRLNVVVDEEQAFQFPLPLQVTMMSESEEVVLGNGSNIPSDEITIVQNKPFTVYGKEEGSYQVGLKLFGWFQFKDIQVDVIGTQYAIPCGAPVGIYLKSDGVLVIGTGEITREDGQIVEPAAGILQSGTIFSLSMEFRWKTKKI